MCAPQPCFVFTHPSDARTVAEIGATDKSRSFRPGPFPDPPRDLLAGAIDNSRVAQLSFDVPLGGELHGFIGYFHSTLWDDGSEAVHISTEPSTESVGMFSWFPLFIPLRTPVLVPEGGRVEGVVDGLDMGGDGVELLRGRRIGAPIVGEEVRWDLIVDEEGQQPLGEGNLFG